MPSYCVCISWKKEAAPSKLLSSMDFPRISRKERRMLLKAMVMLLASTGMRKTEAKYQRNKVRQISK